MGLVIYLLAAIVLVIVVGWAIYVLPTPGPLSAGELAVAMLPAFAILGVLVGLLLGLWLLAMVVRLIVRTARRRRG
jgi:hypothetical protein